MENYLEVFSQRCFDVHALMHKERYLAAMHFGGIAVECLLKAKLIDRYGLKVWYDESPDPDPGHVIKNPKHSYKNALSHLNSLQVYLDNSKEMSAHFERVEYPGCFYLYTKFNAVLRDGMRRDRSDEDRLKARMNNDRWARGHYIATRYLSYKVDENKFKEWQGSFNAVRDCIINAGKLWKRREKNMQFDWRHRMRKRLEEIYSQNDSEWFDMHFSIAGHVDLTVVSRQFAKLSYTERRAQIQKIFKDVEKEGEVVPEKGMLFLYTPDESEMVGLQPSPKASEQEAYSWLDQVQIVANLDTGETLAKHKPRQPLTIAFYSFKGGVGRTTALTHVAWKLAQRGRKVVVVDLDLEAPGLSSAFKSVKNPPFGIIDYFYSHAYTSQEEKQAPDDELFQEEKQAPDDDLPLEEERVLSVAKILGEVETPDLPGRIFLVPAGKLDLNYLAKIEDLGVTIATHAGAKLWTTFLNEIEQHIQPDIILVDSRTGLNKWGAFTLLSVADKAVVFLYPNEQNKQGIELLLNALAGKIELQLIFSPVPLEEAGDLMVQEYSSKLQDHQKKLTTQESEADLFNPPQPITIPYINTLALTPNYPVFELIDIYEKIADAIKEETKPSSHSSREKDAPLNPEMALSNPERRRQLVENLHFPNVEAVATSEDLPLYFQYTNNFEKLLDEKTSLILGHPGTGKTTLYSLFLKHQTLAQKYAGKQIEHVEAFISGHGHFHPNRLSKEDFLYFKEKIAAIRLTNRKISWVDFWRAYLLLRLFQTNILSNYDRDEHFKKADLLLQGFPKDNVGWTQRERETFTELFSTDDLIHITQDWLQSINGQVQKKYQALWLLFDELDVDMNDLSEFDRRNALGGLFILARDFAINRRDAFLFKIFLRESTWDWLSLPNKEFFNGRSISLQWTELDFLRLALRLAQQSTEFVNLITQFFPNLIDQQEKFTTIKIDQLSKAGLNDALQLLWGRRKNTWGSEYVSEWLYRRLSDANAITYPGNLYVLLKEARISELRVPGNEAPPPDDRLLQMQSLNQGLNEVSHYRCKALKAEYPELITFFSSLNKQNVLMPEGDLHTLWRANVEAQSKRFESFAQFIDFLVDIGLLKTLKYQYGDVQQYRFADIYTTGFGLVYRRHY